VGQVHCADGSQKRFGAAIFRTDFSGIYVDTLNWGLGLGEGVINETLVPGSESSRFGQGFAQERKSPTCDVHSEGDVYPRRLDVGLWRAGGSEYGI